MGKFLRACGCSFVIALTPTLAFPQSTTAIQVTNGGGGTGGPVTYCVVGTVTTGSCPMPVSVSGSTGTSNVNVQQVGGTATATGNGTTNAGTQRVTISSDSTGQVAISQTTPGTTNGVQTLSGSTTAVTQATAANLNATVAQPTAANLNATVVGAGTAGTPSGGVVSVQGISGGTAVPVSATSLPLPTGAATAANQSAGTTASPSTVVETTQGAETAGSPVVGLGVRIMGSDGTNARDILTTSGGQISITGTVNANTTVLPNSNSSGAITPVISAATSNLQGKTSAGNLYDAYMTNNSGAVAYLYVFNSASNPSTGAVTAGTASGNYQECIPVPNGGNAGVTFSDIPERYSAGIWLVASSAACGTNTAVSTGVILHGRVQ